MIICYLSFFATFIAVFNGSDSLKPRIAGGHVTSIKKHPYMVRLLLDRRQCPGVILTKDIIITTAHCLPPTTDDWVVRAGSPYNYPLKGTVHDVMYYKIHEKYQRRVTPYGEIYVNDIAVLKIQPPLEFNDEIAPIAMLEADKKVKTGVKATVIGWGLVPMREYMQAPPEAQLYNQFRSVEVPIIDDKICRNHYRRTLSYDLEPGQICAGERNNKPWNIPKKDACRGDDGGPLVVRDRLVGLVSWGYDCERGFNPGVYVDIAYFRNWIDEVLNEWFEFESLA